MDAKLILSHARPPIPAISSHGFPCRAIFYPSASSRTISSRRHLIFTSRSTMPWSHNSRMIFFLLHEVPLISTSTCVSSSTTSPLCISTPKNTFPTINLSKEVQKPQFNLRPKEPPPNITPHRKYQTGLGSEAQNMKHYLDLCLSFLSDHKHQATDEGDEMTKVAAVVEQVHAQVVKLGLLADFIIVDKLVVLYLKVGVENIAVELFETIPVRTVQTYAAFLGYYGRLCAWEDLIHVFISMIEDDLRPDKFLLPRVIKACSALADLSMGLAVHGYTLKDKKMGKDVFVGNSLIDMYANCGDLESSVAVFNAMPQKDLVSWTALVGAYANAEKMEDAMRTFESIKVQGLVPDLICWNALISGYARNGLIDLALDLLGDMKQQGHVPGINSWNGVISGCTQSGLFEEAFVLFFDMLQDDAPNSVTISSILSACSGLHALNLGKVLHAYAIKQNFTENVYVGGSLIDMYLKCGESDSAERVFSNMKYKTSTVWNEMIAAYVNANRMSEVGKLFQLMADEGLKPDVITYNTVLSSFAKSGKKEDAFKWFSEMAQVDLKPNVVSLNSLISGFQQCGLNAEALGLLRLMQSQMEHDNLESHFNSSFPVLVHDIVIHPNAITLTSALSACADLKIKNIGKEIHAYMLRNNFESSVFVSSALVDMYLKCADVFSATKAFCEITEKNTASWNILLSGYSSNGMPEVALKLFPEMLELGFLPNAITVIILLSACSSSAALSIGRGLHCYIAKKVMEEHSLAMEGALLDMYAKCGSYLEARLVFDCATDKDIGLWNAIISCYSLHGMANEALCMFQKMADSGVKADHITFTSILSLCKQQGLVKEGMKCFNSMEDVYGISPTLEHFTCMVGMLGDAGLIGEALEFVRTMRFEPDACVWATLLRSCRLHSDYEIGEMAAKKLFELEPTNPSNYTTLYNIYSMTGLWDDARDVRNAMRARKMKIVKACSWINIGNEIHAFKAGDSSHPALASILETWDDMAYEMENASFVPQDVIFDDVSEVDPFSCFHTEKLAICYGIMSLCAHNPVRVSKNVRMCIDCHTSAKFISKIKQREIFVRDGCAYHHFKDGICSCKDKCCN